MRLKILTLQSTVLEEWKYRLNIGRKFFVCKCDVIIFHIKTIKLNTYVIQKIKDKFKITFGIDEVRGRNEKCILAFLELFDRLKNRSNKMISGSD